MQDDIGKDIVLTILTGGRPGLLADTLRSLRESAPILCKNAWIIALNNGGDRASERSLSACSWIDDIQTTDQLRPIGESVTSLFSMATGSGRPFLLHLEDDWRCCRTETEWLPRAMAIARQDNVAQVRLRLASERVLTYHALRRTPLRWKSHNGFLLSENAHYTFNPSIIRMSLASKLVPCDGEPSAMRLFEARREGRSVAQLSIGVFAHIGGGLSLADQTKGR